MKAIFVFLFFIAMQNLLNAQQIVPNSSFENWHSVPNTFGGEDPDGWRSNNAATAGANRKGVAKSTDAYTGTYSLELTPLISLDSSDYLITQICTGSPDLNYATYTLDIETGGYFFGQIKPGSLYGYYKYTPSANADDSVYAIVHLKKYYPIPDTSGTIGIGLYSFSPSSSYQQFEIPIAQYLNIDTADTVTIAFFYRSNNTNINPTGSLLIDDLSFSNNATFIPELNNGIGLRIFPNPTENKAKLEIEEGITVENISLYGIAGKKVKQFLPLERNLDFSEINSGIYFIQVKTHAGLVRKKIVIQ